MGELEGGEGGVRWGGGEVGVRWRGGGSEVEGSKGRVK